jgi:DNA-binding MarR family transcriptional regulator
VVAAPGRIHGVAMNHPANGLDDLVHQRVRLGILTIAHTARHVEFGYLRETLELTGGNLSQHLATLENAGLITITKGYEGKRPRTWVALTRAGRSALRQEIAHLKRLIKDVEQPGLGRAPGVAPGAVG